MMLCVLHARVAQEPTSTSARFQLRGPIFHPNSHHNSHPNTHLNPPSLMLQIHVVHLDRWIATGGVSEDVGVQCLLERIHL
jgi:hypothetical protein